MDSTAATLYNTPLKDRVLWFDGDSTYKSRDLFEVVQQYPVSYVDAITPDVIEYNKHVMKHEALSIKTELRELTHTWNLPDKAKSIDVVEYITDKHYRDFASAPDFDDRERRLLMELVKYRKYKFDDVLRAIIYIINKLSKHEVVWGVGRGSSVSSYVLYVIGVHDVDSFAYDLDIDDFLHE